MFVAGFIGSPSMNFFTVNVETGGDGTYLVSDGFRLRVPRQYEAAIATGAAAPAAAGGATQSMSGATAGQVIMGLRPEDVADATFIRDADPGNLVEAMVDVVEPLGSEVNLSCLAGTQQFVARVDPRSQAKAGERMTLYFNTNKMHAFNPTTQESLM
jgi:multiple sugar transport system ATP-binding protein